MAKVAGEPEKPGHDLCSRLKGTRFWSVLCWQDRSAVVSGFEDRQEHIHWIVVITIPDGYRTAGYLLKGEGTVHHNGIRLAV